MQIHPHPHTHIYTQAHSYLEINSIELLWGKDMYAYDFLGFSGVFFQPYSLMREDTHSSLSIKGGL